MGTIIQHGNHLSLRGLFEQYDDMELLAENDDDFAEARDMRAILVEIGNQIGCPTLDVLRDYGCDEFISLGAWHDYVTEPEKEREEVTALGIVANYIDWRQYADDNIRPDYNEITIEGHEYLIRGV